MSENHIPEHASPIKTPRQLITVVVLAFVVPVLIIVALVKLAADHKPAPAITAAAEEAVAKRIKPVAEVAVDASAAPRQEAAAPAAAAPVAVAVAPATAGGDAGKGKSVYDASCTACHASGVAGAPKAGDKAAWAPRLKNGKDALYASVLKGKGAMPPKGGNAALVDADIKAAVDYLAGLAK